MRFLVERRKDNIQPFLRYKGLTNSNIIESVDFDRIDNNVAQIMVNFNMNYMDLKWNVNVRDCWFRTSFSRHVYKTKKAVQFWEYPEMTIEWDWRIDDTNLYPNNTFVNVKLFPETDDERLFFPHFYVIGWHWVKYGVIVIIKGGK